METTNCLSAKNISILALLALLAFLLGIWLGSLKNSDKTADFVDATVLQPPRVLEPFDLKTTDGKLFTNDSLKNHWTLLLFGFTHSNTSPATLTMLNEVYNKIKAEKKPLPNVVFISVDPKRDNLDKIKKYVEKFNTSFQGATNEKSCLGELTNQLGVIYIQNKQEKSNQISHVNNLYLINPAGKLHAVFSMPHEANNVFDDYVAIVAQYGDKKTK